MINRHLRSVPGALMAGAIVAIASANGGCSAASTATNALNNAEQATSSCDEFTSGADAVGMLSIDGALKIADTWTAKENGADVDDAVTEACHQASVKISGTLTADAGCNLVIS